MGPRGQGNLFCLPETHRPEAGHMPALSSKGSGNCPPFGCHVQATGVVTTEQVGAGFGGCSQPGSTLGDGGTGWRVECG